MSGRDAALPPRARRAIGARAGFVALALGTIALGLTVHRRGGAMGLGAVSRDVLGDALWATMIAWWLGALAPRARMAARGSVALAICFAVEASQLAHAPWLDALRRTAAGRLVLGSGFDRRDLVAYAAGVLAALLLEHLATRSAGRSPRPRRRHGVAPSDGSAT